MLAAIVPLTSEKSCGSGLIDGFRRLILCSNKPFLRNSFALAHIAVSVRFKVFAICVTGTVGHMATGVSMSSSVHFRGFGRGISNFSLALRLQRQLNQPAET